MNNLVQIFLVLLVLCGGAIMTYAFTGMVTQKKAWRYIITTIIALILAYVTWKTNRSDVVTMKEDVLYIKPKSEVKH